ncbi:MAG: Eco57I restriction-modification methylase domain-containing protein [Bifidobacteriaceae bacterium]|jgi:site-specific DNA-methyltransferase (adenine-specific)|nr:Eco57I restriction-modification methylase domain-containing protein [Bifidobacteriaceae bacterium]
MAEKSVLSLRGRNPDVLTCIANLSNDEVFTPPDVANQMLDGIAEAWAGSHRGDNIWADKHVTFLDPFTKSGVFLREITKRLVDGLESQMPDLQRRVNHVLTKQVFGIAITELTALLARRSVYCSKWASQGHSICRRFNDDSGNIWFEPRQHTWVGGHETIVTADGEGNTIEVTVDGKCSFCGASQKVLDRPTGLESHAYALIHTDSPTDLVAKAFGDNMQFDVIIGNPPYQLEDGGYGTSARPIYQLFVRAAKALEPRFLSMITPSRWFAGGKGLDDFRDEMLKDHRMAALVDYPKLFDAFPGVKIRGGVSHFLWSRDHDGPCRVQTMWDSEPVGSPTRRYLDEFDVLVRRNEAVPILHKVNARGEPTLDARVSSRKPFGLATNYEGKRTPVGMKKPVRLFANQRIAWIEDVDIPAKREWVDDWKVLTTAVQGTSAAVETMFLSKPIIAGPGEACTETYLVAGRFGSREEAERYAAYLRTRFVRFLISLRKATQHATRDVYSFVPDLPMDQVWDEASLYARYELADDEISFIEETVKPMDAPQQGEAD